MLLYDKVARKAKLRFSERLGEVQRKAEGIEYSPYPLLDVTAETSKRTHSSGEKSLALLDNAEKEYHRRQGDLLLLAIKFIKAEQYVTKRKHKVNDKKLKRSLAISDRKVKSRIGSFLLSFAQNCEELSQSSCNRLQEIEAEIEEKRKREEKRRAAVNNSRYSWGK